MPRGNLTHSPSLKKKILVATVCMLSLIGLYHLFGPANPPLHIVPVDVSPPNTCNEGAVQQLRWSPRTFLRNGIISESDHQAIMDYARSKIDIRIPIISNLTNSRAVLIETETPELKRLQKKISEWVMLPESHGEKFVLRRFAPGDLFDVHFDFFEHENQLDSSGQRTSTVVYFLEVPAIGGDFEFVRANLVIPPQRGQALLYHNRLPNAQPDLMSLNGENRVVEGEKWTLTKFFRERPISLN